MAIHSIKQKLVKFLFYKDVAIKIQFFNSFSRRVFHTGEDQQRPPSDSVHTPFLLGELYLQPNFQKVGLDRT